MKIGNAIDNTKLSVKMMILALIVVIAATAPLVILVRGENQIIAQTELELKGVAAGKSLQSLVLHLQDHRGNSTGALAGNQQQTAQMGLAAREVASAFQASREKLSALPGGGLTSRLDTAMSNWETLSRNVASKSISAEDSFAAHTLLIGSVRDLIWKTGEESSFWYDPQPHSYHLILATMDYLIGSVESLGQSRSMGNLVLIKGAASMEQRLLIHSQLAKARQAVTNMRLHMDAALASSGELGRLSALFNNANESAMRSITLAEQEVVLKPNPDYPSSEYFAQLSQVLSELKAFNQEAVNELEAALAARIQVLTAGRNTGLGFILALLAIGAVLGGFIVRGMLKAINALVDATQSIAQGQFELGLNGNRKDEIGILNRAMQTLSGELKKASELAVENNRIRSALDSASVNVMIADSQRNIIYMNDAVQGMLRTAESDIREVLPQFQSNRILGGSMDVFHKNPAHQASLLANLTTSYQTQIKVGKRHFRLLANPILDKQGQRLGSVVEWLDRTEEVRTEQEIAELVQAASQGNFKKRAETASKQGFWLTIASSLNNVMETADKGLSDVARVLTALANGDLSQRIDAEYSGTFDELKTSANTTSSNLAQMISEIREAVETIHTASSEIASGNADLSSRTEQQAASLEETASSMEELTGTVRLNADNAKQANGLASQASGVAVDGGELIGKVVATMGAINDSAQKIADIIGVIDGIAFQTNILALNAAVEAARAGDQGRGFAVVASEVRALAQRSANAAKDIKALISDSVQKISDGNSLVNRSGETMKEVVTSIKRVNDIMQEIAAASAEQASGIDEIGKAVAQMDEMTQQNAALVEEAAAAAESLQSQADQLSSRVASFRLDASHAMQGRTVSARAAMPATRTAIKPAKALAKPAARPAIKAAKNEQEDEWEDF